jgi:multiple sugar transport system permease protein
MGIALAAAYLLNENLRGSVIFKILFFIPVVLSVVSISMVWGYILDYENGLLNQMLALLHLGKVSWLYEPQWVKIGIGMVVVWQGSAFNTIIYYAALQGIPEDLYEAATIDGAGRFRKFWRITVPLLGPYHLFLLVTGLIGALQLFAPIHVMTHGVPAARNIIYEIYWKAYHEFEMGYASALSWVLFLLIFAVSAIYWKFIGKRVHYS